MLRDSGRPNVRRVDQALLLPSEHLSGMIYGVELLLKT